MLPSGTIPDSVFLKATEVAPGLFVTDHSYSGHYDFFASSGVFLADAPVNRHPERSRPTPAEIGGA